MRGRKSANNPQAVLMSMGDLRNRCGGGFRPIRRQTNRSLEPMTLPDRLPGEEIGQTAFPL